MSRAQAAGVTVTLVDPAVEKAAAAVLADAQANDVPRRLVSCDATLWGEAAEAEASIRLGWVDLVATSRALLPEIRRVAEEVAAQGLDHVVLAGMGGSSLAPEVITRSAGVELTVLDTTDPHQLRRALTDRLMQTVVVVSSKSGGTVETDSHRRAYEQAFRDAGLTEDQVAARFVVVTDPGSPLEAAATAAGYRAVFRADPDVGGRFSALTAFGLVPSALAGVDVARLLDEAEALGRALASPSATGQDANPGLLLGAAIGGTAVEGRDKLVLAEAGPAAGGTPLLGFGDWAEQLIAESTGKEGRGVLPVVVEEVGAPGFIGGGADSVGAAYASDLSKRGTSERNERAAGAAGDWHAGEVPGADVIAAGPLGAQFLLWEYATAIAGRALGINPFDQPNVAESKDNTGRLLQTAGPDGSLPAVQPALVDGPVEVYGDEKLFGRAQTLTEALAALVAAVPDRGYLAVMAYLDRVGDAAAAGLRRELATVLTQRHGAALAGSAARGHGAALAGSAARGAQVTFGWGPRFLHSTGQYHKGGPQVGAFLQITGAVTQDLPVPGRPYTFGTLHLAQALGDLGALAGRGRPVLRLHLRDRAGGLAAVFDAVSGLEISR